MIASLLAVVHQRERLVLIYCLTIIIVLAWIWVIFGAGMDMTAIEMTRMAGMDGWMMQPAAWTLGYALFVLSMWWVMMAAMMLPSAAPMMLLFARINSKAATGDRSVVPTSIFVAGYLLVWGRCAAVGPRIGPVAVSNA